MKRQPSPLPARQQPQPPPSWLGLARPWPRSMPALPSTSTEHHDDMVPIDSFYIDIPLCRDKGLPDLGTPCTCWSNDLQRQACEQPPIITVGSRTDTRSWLRHPSPWGPGRQVSPKLGSRGRLVGWRRSSHCMYVSEVFPRLSRSSRRSLARSSPQCNSPVPSDPTIAPALLDLTPSCGHRAGLTD
jgi:hypothetical protein